MRRVRVTCVSSLCGVSSACALHHAAPHPLHLRLLLRGHAFYMLPRLIRCHVLHLLGDGAEVRGIHLSCSLAARMRRPSLLWTAAMSSGSSPHVIYSNNCYLDLGVVAPLAPSSATLSQFHFSQILTALASYNTLVQYSVLTAIAGLEM